MKKLNKTRRKLTAKTLRNIKGGFKVVERTRCFAYDALKAKGSAPVVLNVANDETVAAFLSDKVNFYQIPDIIKYALDSHQYINNPNLEDIENIIDETKITINNKILDR